MKLLGLLVGLAAIAEVANAGGKGPAAIEL